MIDTSKIYQHASGLLCCLDIAAQLGATPAQLSAALNLKPSLGACYSYRRPGRKTTTAMLPPEKVPALVRRLAFLVREEKGEEPKERLPEIVAETATFSFSTKPTPVASRNPFPISARPAPFGWRWWHSREGLLLVPEPTGQRVLAHVRFALDDHNRAEAGDILRRVGVYQRLDDILSEDSYQWARFEARTRATAAAR